MINNSLTDLSFVPKALFPTISEDLEQGRKMVGDGSGGGD